MIVVSNTSPLINLAAVGLLDLLPKIYGQVTIPQAVANEMASIVARKSLGFDPAVAPWVIVRPVTDQPLLHQLELHLDSGEAEAITLANELAADQLLIDESLGRKQAKSLGLRIIGVVGILLLAKQRGLLPAVKPVLSDLQTRAGFWLGQAIVEAVLAAADES